MKASTGPVLPMIVRGCPAKAAYTMPHTAVAAIICLQQRQHIQEGHDINQQSKCLRQCACFSKHACNVPTTALELTEVAMRRPILSGRPRHNTVHCRPV